MYCQGEWHHFVFATLGVSPPSRSTSIVSRYKIFSKKSTLYHKFCRLSRTVRSTSSRSYSVRAIKFLYAAVKSGYPPQTLTIVPELPLPSLGLKQGEQIIVSSKAGATVRGPSPPPKPKPTAPTPTRPPVSNSVPRSNIGAGLLPVTSSNAKQAAEPASVVTDGGYLVHRVSLDMLDPTTSSFVIVELCVHLCIRCM